MPIYYTDETDSVLKLLHHNNCFIFTVNSADSTLFSFSATASAQCFQFTSISVSQFSFCKHQCCNLLFYSQKTPKTASTANVPKRNFIKSSPTATLPNKTPRDAVSQDTKAKV